MEIVQLIINIIVTLLFPFLVGLVYWIIRNLAQHLPEHQRPTLEQFARMAVQQVEQQYPGNPSKAALAEASILKLYQEFHLPAPSKAILQIALEAATYSYTKTRP